MVSGLSITSLAQGSTWCPVEGMLAFYRWQEGLASPALRCAVSAMISLLQLRLGQARSSSQYDPVTHDWLMEGSVTVVVSNLGRASLTGSPAGLALLLLGTAMTADHPMRQAAWQVLQCCCSRGQHCIKCASAGQGQCKGTHEHTGAVSIQHIVVDVGRLWGRRWTVMSNACPPPTEPTGDRLGRWQLQLNPTRSLRHGQIGAAHLVGAGNPEGRQSFPCIQRTPAKQGSICRQTGRSCCSATVSCGNWHD